MGTQVHGEYIQIVIDAMIFYGNVQKPFSVNGR